ncbi:hypothetical protein ONS95_014544 [Cadophora gregata]|uniref:uncharacterized protein n=1 Tax=Cadophora gregata TaxID=51156 RepID=UPI0026DAF8E0|nr:uncharacterized protein ONS95_014544 [Cadophora gregata]KAK0112815.1 hypothetical protein ONS95_014544 [Cadophora gregata]KAK0124931.1 hypothetical protein ONS96_008806 [Cadophora gregata f. sp. sojae]
MANTPSIHIPYPYETLKSGEIRLLKILPGSQPDRIKCKLISEYLESKPSYDALSYSWGSSKDQHHDIWIDGFSARVRDNLYDSLLSLRRKCHERVLWVDAISINQSNDKERSSQIPRMGEIYEQADKVFIYIGAKSNNSRQAFSFVREIYKLMCPYGPENDPELRKYTLLNFINDPQNLHKWWALDDLCKRRYWKRRWIIQEIALASRRRIQCGEDYLDWEPFEAVCQEIEKLPKPNDRDQPFPSAVDSIRESLATRHASLRSQGRRTFSLQFLLEAFEHSRCKEPRDKIYAVLALADLSSPEPLIANYEKPLLEVYVDVTWFLARNYESKTPLGTRHLGFSKSIVRASQAVQRNLGDVSLNIKQDVLEAISASLSIPRSMAAGVILIKGLLGGVLTHTHPYTKDTSIPNVADTFRKLPSYHCRPRKTLKRTTILQHGVDGFDEDDQKRVVSFNSRISYGMRGWSPAQYEPRDEEQVSDGGFIPEAHGRNVKRRNSIEVKAGEFKVFLEKSGLMGIAPAEAKEGDFTCHFLNCDAAAIIRRQGDKYFFVGRTLIFNREGCSSMRLNEWSTKNFKYFVPNEEELPACTNSISFYVDVATLQLLTR